MVSAPVRLAMTVTFFVEAPAGARGLEVLGRLAVALGPDQASVEPEVLDVMLHNDGTPQLDLTTHGIRLYYAVFENEDPVAKLRKVHDYLTERGFVVNPDGGPR